MQSLLSQIRADLKASVNQQTLKTAQHFFKEPIKVYGIKTAVVSKIAKKHWSQAKMLSKLELFELCEELFQADFMEEAFIVSEWLPRYIKHLIPDDLATFRGWIEKYINNWAKCDSFCNHTIGDLLQKYPETIKEVQSWANSQNRWLKRASAVSLIVPAKKGLFLKEAIEIADALLLDPDDLVQKGYGWLLKEESRKHQKEVYEYVVKNRQIMPRTALRYAIELMPKELKAEAIKKK
ncbi:MAG: DNA alkylation repair protein [Candidatus Bathyarchaeota archaeon]|nr:DNA alkylation repair protein [Candidatus Bathyarchaeota archaeon]